MGTVVVDVIQDIWAVVDTRTFEVVASDVRTEKRHIDEARSDGPFVANRYVPAAVAGEINAARYQAELRLAGIKDDIAQIAELLGTGAPPSKVEKARKRLTRLAAAMEAS